MMPPLQALSGEKANALLEELAAIMEDEQIRSF
jgi:hypothetical protein